MNPPCNSFINYSAFKQEEIRPCVNIKSNHSEMIQIIPLLLVDGPIVLPKARQLHQAMFRPAYAREI